jgi:hypothetical protein
MSQKPNPVIVRVSEAIEQGEPLSVSEIRATRACSRKASNLLKSAFWIGIVIFNLAFWVPLPIAVNPTLLNVVAVFALVAALTIPFLGLRRHNVSLALLKVNREPLKKKTVSAAGQHYLDRVKAMDRPLINAEYELLNGSKWQQSEQQAGKAE